MHAVPASTSYALVYGLYVNNYGMSAVPADQALTRPVAATAPGTEAIKDRQRWLTNQKVTWQFNQPTRLTAAFAVKGGFKYSCGSLQALWKYQRCTLQACWRCTGNTQAPLYYIHSLARLMPRSTYLMQQLTADEVFIRRLDYAQQPSTVSKRCILRNNLFHGE